jgi:hypothetical protein
MKHLHEELVFQVCACNVEEASPNCPVRVTAVRELAALVNRRPRRNRRRRA